MLTNILEYLEHTLTWLPEKRAFWDDGESLTFSQLSRQARSVGTFLHDRGLAREGVAVCMKRRPKTIAAFFGVLYSGCYYVPLDGEMSSGRMNRILEKVQPCCILCDRESAALLAGTAWEGLCTDYETAAQCPVDEGALTAIRAGHIDTDPAYVVFTSGSTGEPKGVMTSHRSVLDYIEHLGAVLKSDSNSVFGSQAPFYFDACLKEVLCTVKYGASCYIIPKVCFSFPVRLLEALNRNRVNTVCWVASALTMVSSRNTFDRIRPEYLHTVVFAGEAFPTRQLLLWQKALPGARFINLYGPTEATGTCCYYEVNRPFQPGESLPIGRPFANTGILLLDEEGKPDTSGEICIRGSCLALGYYREPELTKRCFTFNPANPDFRERIYRTGDFGTYNAYGELMYLGRKDSQVKHMGHRIELGDIEATASAHPDVRFACCQYDEGAGLQLFYTGSIPCPEMMAYLRQKLPKYMLPKSLYYLEFMPMTPNGKIDRSALRSNSRKGVYPYEQIADHSEPAAPGCGF